jgi:hypothetical protein
MRGSAAVCCSSSDVKVAMVGRWKNASIGSWQENFSSTATIISAEANESPPSSKKLASDAGVNARRKMLFQSSASQMCSSFVRRAGSATARARHMSVW